MAIVSPSEAFRCVEDRYLDTKRRNKNGDSFPFEALPWLSGSKAVPSYFSEVFRK